jgi:hypothetical protein
MRCACSPLSPFLWRHHKRPSIFLDEGERGFAADINGNSRSQVATASAVRFEKKTGRSMGTIGGISSAGDSKTEELNAHRARRRKASGTALT